jgi:hypothetical protein
MRSSRATRLSAALVITFAEGFAGKSLMPKNKRPHDRVP